MKPQLFIPLAVSAVLAPFTLAQEVVEVEVVEEIEIVEGPGIPVPGTDVDVDVDIAPAANLPKTEALTNDPIGTHIAASPGLTKLRTLIEAADFAPRLQAPGPMTFFTPTDAAFRELSDEEFQTMMLPANKPRLIKLLERHLIPGLLPAREMKAGAITTSSGEQIMIVVEGEEITVGEANLNLADLPSGNGTYHMVDRFLRVVPPADGAEKK